MLCNDGQKNAAGLCMTKSSMFCPKMLIHCKFSVILQIESNSHAAVLLKLFGKSDKMFGEPCILSILNHTSNAKSY